MEHAGHHAVFYLLNCKANGENDITIKILYCGICHSDLHLIKNNFGISSYPIVPWHEIVGVCQNELENYCPKRIHTSTIFDDGGVAPLLGAGITVFSPMKFYGLEKPGMHVGVVGLGGLGHLAVKFAKALGMKVGMVEFIGLLKVKVIKGVNLAIRDMMSSDPYVVLSLGQQTTQTTIIKSNLNPVWNEELMLSVPQDYGPVKLRVFDHDTFSSDDIMGEAEIDIQPLLTSAMAFGDPEMFANMQIGKWLKSDDNALIGDSIINIIDGKVRQKILLKLQNVESWRN
ncbi:hypothetical protein Patl1_11393 [Pistacia atlantica]|uniref:Uncharacterized protein n=1 Tax=Pistacia atlantica TaxID=434234 RepID=A0ACC1A2Z8_9ROSI|nr:hypothetical protein Patl1_11393 [Pistacia atlantica]